MSKNNFLIAVLIALAAPLGLPTLYAASPIRDTKDAMEFCRVEELDRIEGIWEFPEDRTSVLIRRTNINGREYELVLLNTPDCRLVPGERIGLLTPSADANRYKLSLYMKRDLGVLASAHSCTAEFKENAEALYIHPMKLRLSFRLPTYFLPKFWKLLNISFDNPGDDLPRGLRKLYPITSKSEKLTYL